MERQPIKQVKRLLALLITPLLISSTLPIGRVSAEDIATAQSIVAAPTEIVTPPNEPPLTVVEPTKPSIPNVVAETFIAAPLTNAEPQQSSQSSAAIVSTVPVVPEPVALSLSPLLITGYRASVSGVDFVQLYNNSDVPLRLQEWQVTGVFQYQGLPTEHPLALPDVIIKPLSYIVIGWNNFAPDADVEAVPFMNYAGSVLSSLEVGKVQPGTYTNDTALVAAVNPYGTNTKLWHWRDNRSTATNKYSLTAKTFRLSTYTTPAQDLYGGGIYQLPESVQLKIVEVVANSRDCSPLDTSIDCGDYVKLFNPSDNLLELAGLRMRSGYQGQNSTTSNTALLAGFVPAGGYATVWQREDGQRVNLTNTGGYIWIEDMYGMKLYENTVQEYPSAGAEKNKGQSWALDSADGQWKWTIPAPLTANIFQTVAVEGKGATTPDVADCGEGRERNPETNRCRNIPVSTLAACGIGQERNPETNRCRGTLSTATSLASCSAGQERNPDTNRCRAVASASTLVACKEGQERNPETNRCRAVASTVAVSDTPYAVAATAASKGARTGWIIVGLILIAAVGYGAYEWRREIGKFFSGIIPGKK